MILCEVSITAVLNGSYATFNKRYSLPFFPRVGDNIVDEGGIDHKVEYAEYALGESLARVHLGYVAFESVTWENVFQLYADVRWFCDPATISVSDTIARDLLEGLISKHPAPPSTT